MHTRRKIDFPCLLIVFCGRPRKCENGLYFCFWGGGWVKNKKKVDAVKTEVDDLSMRLETRDKERKEQVRRAHARKRKTLRALLAAANGRNNFFDCNRNKKEVDGHLLPLHAVSLVFLLFAGAPNIVNVCMVMSTAIATPVSIELAGSS